jgi:hypothetical protein
LRDQKTAIVGAEIESGVKLIRPRIFVAALPSFGRACPTIIVLAGSQFGCPGPPGGRWLLRLGRTSGRFFMDQWASLEAALAAMLAAIAATRHRFAVTANSVRRA